MLFFKYVVVILVYRNVSDLQNCIDGIVSHIKSCKIIVVNSFYDEISHQEIEQVAQKNHCDFINIPNRGYSYGNNCGIEWAKQHYNFDYLIVSNPDTVIQRFDDKFTFEADAIAPIVLTRTGKNQNPMFTKDCLLAKYLTYLGFVKQQYFYWYLGLLINKIIREVRRYWKKLCGQKYYPIYAAHGSFLIFSHHVIDVLHPIYDENMFLFAEEGVVADKMRGKGLKTIYTTQIQILHHEDGSIKMSDICANKEIVRSTIYYYEHYVKGK